MSGASHDRLSCTQGRGKRQVPGSGDGLPLLVQSTHTGDAAAAVSHDRSRDRGSHDDRAGSRTRADTNEVSTPWMTSVPHLARSGHRCLQTLPPTTRPKQQSAALDGWLPQRSSADSRRWPAAAGYGPSQRNRLTGISLGTRVKARSRSAADSPTRICLTRPGHIAKSAPSGRRTRAGRARTKRSPRGLPRVTRRSTRRTSDQPKR